MLVLLRHASAGERIAPPSVDYARRLDRRGYAEARGLAGSLARYAFERVLSSPLPRCVETVDPLVVEVGVELELRDELAPGAAQDELLALLDEVRGHAVLACTHREAFEVLFDGEVTCEKAGAWVVDRTPSGWCAIDYLAPPAPVVPERTSLVAASG